MKLGNVRRYSVCIAATRQRPMAPASPIIIESIMLANCLPAETPMNRSQAAPPGRPLPAAWILLMLWNHWNPRRRKHARCDTPLPLPSPSALLSQAKLVFGEKAFTVAQQQKAEELLATVQMRAGVLCMFCMVATFSFSCRTFIGSVP